MDNSGVASMYYNGKNPEQTTEEDQDNKKLVGIALSVFFVVIFLLRIFFYFVDKAGAEQNGTEVGNRVRQQRPSIEAGSWVDRAPPSPVAGAAATMEVAAVQAAEPPLVCRYKTAEGWRDGSCGVCLAEMADGDVLRVMPVCMHYFHAACVGEWLRAYTTCPLCRGPVAAPAAAAARC